MAAQYIVVSVDGLTLKYPEAGSLGPACWEHCPWELGCRSCRDRILADSFMARTMPELQRAGDYLGFPAVAKATESKAKTEKTADPVRAMPELIGTAASS